MNKLILGFESFLDSAGLRRGLASLNGDIGRLEQKMNRAGQGMNGTLRTMGLQAQVAGRQAMQYGRVATGMGGDVLGVIGSWVKEAGDFEEEMNKLSIVTRAVGGELKHFKDLAIQKGIETAFDPQEVVRAFTGLKQAGLDNLEVMTAMPAVLDLVAASSQEIDLEQGALVASVAMNKFGFSAKHAGSFMDELVRTTQVSNLRFKDAERLMRSMGGVAATLSGTPRTSFLALAGAGRNMGLTARLTGKAIQALGRSLDNIQGQVGRGRGFKLDAMKKLGITIEDLKDKSGAWLDLIDIIRVVNTKAGQSGLKEAERNAAITAMFAQNAKNLIVGALKLKSIDPAGTGQQHSGVNALLQMRAALTDTKDITGLAEVSAKKFLSTWNGINKLFQGSVKTFKQVLGDTLLPLLKQSLQSALSFVNGILQWIASSKTARIVIIGLSAALGVLLVASGSLLIVFGGLITAGAGLASVWATVALATTVLPFLFSAATAAAGVLLATLWEFALVGAAIYAAFKILAFAWEKDFGGIRTYITNIFNAISAGWRVLVGSLTGEPIALEDLITLKGGTLLTIIRVVGKLWFRLKALAKGVAMEFQPAWDLFVRAMGVASDAVASVIDIFTQLLGFDLNANPPLGGAVWWRDVGRAIGMIAGFIFNVFSVFIVFVSKVTTILAALVKGVIVLWKSLIDVGATLINIGDGWVDGILAGLKRGWHRVTNWFDDSVRSLNPFSSAPTAPKSSDNFNVLEGDAFIGGSRGGSRSAPPRRPLPSSIGSGLVSSRSVSGVASSSINVVVQGMDFHGNRLNGDEAKIFAEDFAGTLAREIRAQKATAF